jgi:hypothetical protein
MSALDEASSAITEAIMAGASPATIIRGGDFILVTYRAVAIPNRHGTP